MKLATTTGDFFRFDISEQERIRYIAQAGFRYIDFNFYPYMSRDCRLMQDDYLDYFKEIYEYGKSLGVEFVQSHAPNTNPLWNDKLDLNVTLNCRAIEVCQLMGIPNMVIHAGWADGIGKEEFFSRNRAFMEKILPTAEKCGVNVLIENSCHGNMREKYYFFTGEDMAEFIRYVNHPFLHAAWDVGHGNCEGDQSSQFQALGKELYALHVHDTDGKMDNHDYLFTGTLNIDDLMQGLIDNGFTGCFTLECESPLLWSGEWNQSRIATLSRRPFEKSTKLFNPPIEIQCFYEELLFKTASFILEQYGLSE